MKPRGTARRRALARRTLLLQALAVLFGGLTACASLLPHGSSATPTPFASFEQARDASAKVVAFQTRTSDLKSLGFDPHDGANVTLIPYPEVVARLAPHPGVPLAELEPGVRQCIQAQSLCSAYLFHFEQQDRRREGGFWSDFLNISRVTKVSGWWFDLLVVVSSDTVLFRNIAGQARMDRLERQTNPLGPLQPAGESAGAVLLR